LFRRWRTDKPEQTLLVAHLVDPPQGEDFKPLQGDLFPSNYPLIKSTDDPYKETPGYFHRKYYIT